MIENDIGTMLLYSGVILDILTFLLDIGFLIKYKRHKGQPGGFLSSGQKGLLMILMAVIGILWISAVIVTGLGDGMSAAQIAVMLFTVLPFILAPGEGRCSLIFSFWLLSLNAAREKKKRGGE